MTGYLLIPAGAFGWALFVLIRPAKDCGKCSGWGMKGRGKPCPRCDGTGKRFRFLARAVHKGVVLAIDYVRDRRAG